MIAHTCGQCDPKPPLGNKVIREVGALVDREEGPAQHIWGQPIDRSDDKAVAGQNALKDFGAGDAEVERVFGLEDGRPARYDNVVCPDRHRVGQPMPESPIHVLHLWHCADDLLWEVSLARDNAAKTCRRVRFEFQVARPLQLCRREQAAGEEDMGGLSRHSGRISRS